MIELKLKKDELGNKVFIGFGEDADFRCFQCRKEITSGFRCENDERLILCRECQDNFKMSKCKHDSWKQHQHIKFIRHKEDAKL